jgi:hypothetical protein
MRVPLITQVVLRSGAGGRNIPARAGGSPRTTRSTPDWLVPNAAARARSVGFVRSAAHTIRTRCGSGWAYGLALSGGGLGSGRPRPGRPVRGSGRSMPVAGLAALAAGRLDRGCVGGWADAGGVDMPVVSEPATNQTDPGTARTQHAERVALARRLTAQQEALARRLTAQQEALSRSATPSATRRSLRLRTRGGGDGRQPFGAGHCRETQAEPCPTPQTLQGRRWTRQTTGQPPGHGPHNPKSPDLRVNS